MHVKLVLHGLSTYLIPVMSFLLLFYYYCELIVQNISLVEGIKTGSFLVFNSSSGCLFVGSLVFTAFYHLPFYHLEILCDGRDQ